MDESVRDLRIHGPKGRVVPHRVEWRPISDDLVIHVEGFSPIILSLSEANILQDAMRRRREFESYCKSRDFAVVVDWRDNIAISADGWFGPDYEERVKAFLPAVPEEDVT